MLSKAEAAFYSSDDTTPASLGFFVFFKNPFICLFAGKGETIIVFVSS